MDIINVVAIMLAPIVSVIIGQFLLNKSEKRKDKMHIFKTLMTSRLYGWTPESVHCLNLIDIVFRTIRKLELLGRSYMISIALRNLQKLI